MAEASQLNYQIDGQACTAQAFYDVACNPMRHAVVEACAGAGKTWILVARMARALYLGAAPDSILAITFTKKAAGEMRQRLLKDLAEWSQMDDVALAQALAQRGMHDLDAQGLARARGLHSALLDSDRHVQVRTFHSWFAQLLRHAPMEVFRELGLPVQHELLEDDAAACEEAWPLFLAQVQADASAWADYQAAVMSIGRSQTQDALMAALARRAELRLADEAGVLTHSVSPVAALCPRFAEWSPGDDPLVAVPELAQALWGAAHALGTQGKTAASQRKGAELEQALSDGDLLAAEAVLRTKTGTRRTQGMATHQPEALEQAQDWLDEWQSARHQAQCLAHQARMVGLSRLLLQVYAELKRQRNWVDMNDLETAATHLLANGQVAAWIQQRLDQQVQHLLVDEFQDTNPLQWQALRAWLEGYAGAGGGGQGLRVFIVGDPKQSIYRFRRADPRVFVHAREFAQEALGAQVLSCDHTRRCARAVVQACNAVMAAQDRQGETAVAYREHSAQRADLGEVWQLPLVQAESEASGAEPDAQPSPGSDVWRDSLMHPRDVAKTRAAEREALALAKRLAAHLATGACQPGEVMVLARRNARLALLHQALNDLGVPSAFAEKSPLIDAPVVADVVALLDAATSPTHDLSLARALKSPMFGASDAELMAIARARVRLGTDRSWWQVLQSDLILETTPEGSCPQQWRERAAAWAHNLQKLSELLTRLPVHDVLVWWYEQVGIEAAYAAAVPLPMQASARAQLRAVLAQSQNQDSGRFVSPYELVRTLMSAQREVAWPVPAQAVRLLTIHGAKGLEAKLVVLMDTHAPAQAAQTMGVLWDWPVQQRHPSRVVFVMRESQPPLCARDLLAREQWARQAEDINLLYVALTRAEDALWISGHVPHRDAEHSWYQQLQAVGLAQAPTLEPVVTPTAAGVVSRSGEANPGTRVGVKRMIGDVVPDWGAAVASVSEGLREEPCADALTPGEGTQAFLAPESGEGALDNDEAARIGQAMHAGLQWHVPQQAWTTATWQALQAQFALDDDGMQRAQTMAQAIVSGEAGWAWDASVIDAAYAEIDVAQAGQVLRIDRVVRRRDTGAWWVLDFKSHQHPADHAQWRAQVMRYARIWASAHPGDEVHAALVGGDGRLWPLSATTGAINGTPPDAGPPAA